MARKNIVPGFQQFGTAGANMSSTNTVTSTVSETQYMDNIGIIVNWTGTSPVGTLAVQASNDQSTWVSLDFGSAISISGSSGSHNIDINQFPYTHIRSVYTNASGTGTLNSTITVKQMGG